jgi:hypothetical protein
VHKGTAYHLWVRLRALNNSVGNDSIHVQFSGSVDSLGSATWRIGTTSSAEIVQQNGTSDTSVSGWGWSENGWGSLGPHVYFSADGTQTVRVQQREDGAIVDEIVLSPDTYLTAPPGTRDNDTHILPANDGSGSSTSIVTPTADRLARREDYFTVKTDRMGRWSDGMTPLASRTSNT